MKGLWTSFQIKGSIGSISWVPCLINKGTIWNFIWSSSNEGDIVFFISLLKRDKFCKFHFTPCSINPEVSCIENTIRKLSMFRQKQVYLNTDKNKDISTQTKTSISQHRQRLNWTCNFVNWELVEISPNIVNSPFKIWDNVHSPF